MSGLETIIAIGAGSGLGTILLTKIIKKIIGVKSFNIRVDKTERECSCGIVCKKYFKDSSPKEENFHYNIGDKEEKEEEKEEKEKT